jgi:LysR family transcriptional activator of nhaA
LEHQQYSYNIFLHVGFIDEYTGSAMRDVFNYKHLYYFWRVAHDGSISKASQTLHVTPQTISGQLSLLEESIGSAVFEKEGRGLVLTDLGKVVLRYADEIFELGRELSDVLRGAPAVGASEFVVSAASALPKTIVFKMIEPALHLPHEVNLVCKEGPVEAILADLAIHKVDMVLSDTPLSAGYKIKAYNHFLGESSLAAFAPAKTARSIKRNFPNSLNGTPLLLPTSQYAIRKDLDAWFEEQAIFPLLRGQFDDSALIKSFAQAGEGVFFMPRLIAEEICENFNVRVVGEIPEVSQKYYAISTERKVKHPAVAAICDNARTSLFD